MFAKHQAPIDPTGNLMALKPDGSVASRLVLPIILFTHGDFMKNLGEAESQIGHGHLSTFIVEAQKGKPNFSAPQLDIDSAPILSELRLVHSVPNHLSELGFCIPSVSKKIIENRLTVSLRHSEIHRFSKHQMSPGPEICNLLRCLTGGSAANVSSQPRGRLVYSIHLLMGRLCKFRETEQNEKSS